MEESTSVPLYLYIMNALKYQKAADEYVANTTLTLTQVSEKHHVHRTLLSNLLKSQGVEIRKLHASPAKIEEAAREYASSSFGCLSRICQKYHMKQGTLRKKLRELNIDIRRRKYQFDERFFQIIDTEEKAYWLGFFCADGYMLNTLNSISFGLARKDKKHIEKFASIFGVPTRDVEKTNKTRSKKYKQTLVSVSSVQLVKDLLSLGVPQQKTLDLDGRVFEAVPNSLIHHFVRGYFDGDGHIGKTINNQHVSSIVGTYGFLSRLSDEVSKRCKIANHIPKNFGSYSKICINGNCQLEIVKNWMYDNATVFLERKKKIFDEVKDDRPKKTSIHLNVGQNKRTGKWFARKMVDGKDVWGGTFDTEEEAIVRSKEM